MYKEKIEAYFNAHRDEMTADICRLISIRSVKGDAKEGRPFGDGPAEALEAALEMAVKSGFKTKNFDNYVGTVDINDNETLLGILVHLDVVDAAENWTTNPFEGVIKDGKIYGRGASDNKGPSVASLYALKAIKDMEIPLKKNARLILGTDEESGSSDIRYYFKKEAPPPLTFSPDGEFPVINIEKGGFRPTFEAEFEESQALPRIISIKGGYRLNVVPPRAEAVIEGMDKDRVEKYLEDAALRTGARYAVISEENDKLKIIAEGEGAHASTPQKGINAITALLELLSKMPFADSEGFNRLKSLNEIFPHGDNSGKAAGIAMSDEVSGELTLSFSIFEYSTSKLDGRFDSRIPVCATEENTMEVLYERMIKHGIVLNRSGFSRPHHTPEDSDFIRTLLADYEMYTGQKGYCMAIGGGTYVHWIEGGVCFGCVMPGCDTRMHSNDEFIVIDDIITAAKIFTQVIIDLCS